MTTITASKNQFSTSYLIERKGESGADGWCEVTVSTSRYGLTNVCGYCGSLAPYNFTRLFSQKVIYRVTVYTPTLEFYNSASEATA